MRKQVEKMDYERDHRQPYRLPPDPGYTLNPKLYLRLIDFVYHSTIGLRV